MVVVGSSRIVVVVVVRVVVGVVMLVLVLLLFVLAWICIFTSAPPRSVAVGPRHWARAVEQFFRLAGQILVQGSKL